MSLRFLYGALGRRAGRWNREGRRTFGEKSFDLATNSWRGVLANLRLAGTKVPGMGRLAVPLNAISVCLGLLSAPRERRRQAEGGKRRLQRMHEVSIEGHCKRAELNFAVRRTCENPQVRAPVQHHVSRQGESSHSM